MAGNACVVKASEWIAAASAPFEKLIQDALEAEVRRVEVDQVHVGRLVGQPEVGQVDAFATVAFGGGASACVIDEYLAHESRDHRHEVAAIRTGNRARVGQPQPRFVDQGRGLQSVIGALAAEKLAGESAHFRMQHAEKAIARDGIALTPG